MPETQKHKKITVEFYRVEMPDNTASFAKLIEKVAARPDDGGRTRKVTGEPIRLACSSKWQDCVEGDMVHIRMGVLPQRVKLSGQAKQLELDADEGLGAETAFLYDPRTRVIAIQRNRQAVSHTRLALYFGGLGKLDDAILLTPVLKTEAYKAMKGMARHSKISMRVAGLENMEAFGDALGVKEFGVLSKALEFPQVDMELSVGRSRSKNLSRQKVVQLVKGLLGFAKNEPGALMKLVVTGNEDEDAPCHPLNLLEYCMEEVRSVPIGLDRQVHYRDRKAAVRDAYSTRKGDLKRLFAKPGKFNA